MNTNYHFSDIIGTTYKNGSIRFKPDGFTIICPNGSRLKVIGLKRNISRTSNVQSKSDIRCLAINGHGTHAFVADTSRRVSYVYLNTDIVLYSFILPEKVKTLCFSPDSKMIAIGVGGTINIYSLAIFSEKKFNPMTMVNKFTHSNDENVNTLDWSLDGSLIVAGGENRQVKIFAACPKEHPNFVVFTFSERAPLVAVWFLNQENELICVSRNGATSCWEYTNPEKTSEHQNPRFSRRRKVNLCQNVESGVQISAATINKPNKLLVTAFTNGIFCIHEINDDFTLLQSFRAGEQRINSVDINRSGEWLAIGCGTGHATQLLVWEWKSESYILRQQSHSQTITTAVYSPDGSILATGAEDGKVKLWDYATSLCLVTFNEHETGVTDVCFTQSGRAILSASLEGAIRAHDLKRYRNFRTLTAPKQTQLDHICADNSGDIVMATSRDHFEIYIWALETGQCLGILTGHADLISGLATFENTLCSVSNDKTLKFWNILEGSCVESVQLLSDGLDVKYSPSGSMLAVLCYDSNIDLFDTRNTKQIGVIETKLDIDAGRLRAEKVKKSKLEKNKTFTCIAFLPNGQYLLAGGQSNVFCLYSVPDKIRVRTFRLSMNLSLDGTAFDFDYRKATEFGHLDLFDLTDSDEEETNPHKRIRLPGTRHTDLSERAIKPAILINKISFSPTGQDFAIVSTEGVHIFTLSQSRHFEPFKLEVNVTSQEILKMSRTGEHIRALMLALKLNDETLLKNVVERIPVEQIRFVITSLGIEFAERLLAWIGATNCRTSAPNRHFHFYLLICKELLYAYGNDFKRSLERNKPALTAIQRNIAHQQNLIMNLSAQNKHTLEYLIMTRNMAMTQLSTD